MPSTISTTITNAITLGAGNYSSNLTITNTGAVTGTGGNLAISGPAGSSLDNQGVVEGGAGGNGAGGNPFGSHPGGAGGAAAAGVSLASAFITNTGTVAGGTGGTGGNGAVYRGAFFGDGANGGAGGTGGAGLVLNGGAGVNQGVIAGGAGGVGGNGGFGFGYYNGGNGGNGAAGVLLSGGAMLTNAGTIMGGAGGAGGNGHHNGGGGAAGTGAYVNGGTLTNAGTISGSNAVLFGASVGTLVVESGAVFNGAVVANSAVADVLEFSGTSVSDFTGIGDSVLNFNQISFATGAAWTIAGDAAGLASGQTIANFLSGNTIDLTDIAAATETFANGVLTLASATGAVLADLILNEPAGKASTNTFLLAPDGNGGTDITSNVPCFAAGTRLRTPRGEVAVEDLAVGDEVITSIGQQKIKWIGHRKLDLRAVRAPETLYLVRIRRDAFAPSVPQRDLLVTQDHCLFIDGGLIPARMLVNDRSIILDRDIRHFTVYHVELARHDILLAENLPAESYLDTGNRANFSNAVTTALHPDFTLAQTHKNWADAAAPLTTGRATVEPIWRVCAARAEHLGFAFCIPAPILTTDPDPRIQTQDGDIIRPLRQTGSNYLFMLPAGVSNPRLISRTFRPSETIGPFVDDRRDLGVLVGSITLHQGRRATPITAHLMNADLPGWFGPETTPHRWTNGDATLPISAVTTSTILAIQILTSGPYKIALTSPDSAIAA